MIELLNHILARVGLRSVDDGSDGAGYVVPEFTLTPATSGLEAVRSLLAMAGLAACWQENGALQVLELGAWAPLTLSVGPYEIYSASLGARLPEANSMRVYGQDAALNQVGGAWTDAEGAQRLGLSLTRTQFDARITSAAQAALCAASQATRDTRHERVTVPLAGACSESTDCCCMGTFSFRSLGVGGSSGKAATKRPPAAGLATMSTDTTRSIWCTTPLLWNSHRSAERPTWG